MVNHLGNPIAKPNADIGQSGRAALIFDRIVQTGCDSLILISPVFQRDCGRAKQVRDIWCIGALAELVSVNAARLGKGLVKTAG